MFCFRSKISGGELLLFEGLQKARYLMAAVPCSVPQAGDRDPGRRRRTPPGLLHQRRVLHDLVLARSVCVQFGHELASAHYSDPMAHSQQLHQVG